MLISWMLSWEIILRSRALYNIGGNTICLVHLLCNNYIIFPPYLNHSTSDFYAVDTLLHANWCFHAWVIVGVKSMYLQRSEYN